MNLIIFAGGAGTRLWPISRVSSPKQFAPLVGEQSTLQMAVERVKVFGLENIFIATNEAYVGVIQKQIPELSKENIFGEPQKRDVGPAVGLALMRLKKRGVSGPVAILWADHFMDRPEIFTSALRQAEGMVKENPQQFVLFGETPRFANQNIGWMHVGKEIGKGQHAFLEWVYRPEIKAAKKMFKSGKWLWNPGYFVFDIDFCLSLYETFQPKMYAALEVMCKSEQKIQEMYPTLESISFDNAIVEKLGVNQARVLPVDMGWSDPGTLYALKEAFAPSQSENYVKGNVVTLDTKDSFIYNEEEGKLVATIGLDGVCVVNTGDAILVCGKDDVPRIKELLAKLKDEGEESYL